MTKTHLRRWLPASLLLLALTVLVYRPGLQGPFLFDDNPNILKNQKIAIHDLSRNQLLEASLSGISGPLKRPISMASFSLNYYAAQGFNPQAFKATNLVIHLLNGTGIFLFILLLCRFYQRTFQPRVPPSFPGWLSLAVSAAWLLHPMNLTSVLYVVQRMTSLSAFFTICGLTLFLWGRIQMYDGRRGRWAILAGLLFTPLAALCKENGLLLPVLMLIVEACFFNFKIQKQQDWRFLLTFYVLTIALPLLVITSYFVAHPEWLLGGYAGRSFSLSERLLTEPRALWFYLWQIILPSNIQLGLFHDDFVVSTSLLHPFTTLISILGLAALLVLALIARKKQPLISFAVLFFLAGHALESTFIPLELVHEHRNYLPMVGILLVLFFYLLYPVKYLANLRLRQAVAVLLIALFAFVTFSRAIRWSNPFDLFTAEVQHHPLSSLSNGELGAVYASIHINEPTLAAMYYGLAREHFQKAMALDKHDTKPLFALIKLNADRNMEINLGWLRELRERLQDAPYAANSSDKLLDLTTCKLKEKCKLPDADLEAIIQAALSNPTLGGINRAKVLYAYSTYLINVAQDYPLALKIMHKMINVAPTMSEYRETTIEFLIALGRLKEADKELKILEEIRPSSTNLLVLKSKLSEASQVSGRQE